MRVARQMVILGATLCACSDPTPATTIDACVDGCRVDVCATTRVVDVPRDEFMARAGELHLDGENLLAGGALYAATDGTWEASRELDAFALAGGRYATEDLDQVLLYQTDTGWREAYDRFPIDAHFLGGATDGETVAFAYLESDGVRRTTLRIFGAGREDQEFVGDEWTTFGLPMAVHRDWIAVNTTSDLTLYHRDATGWRSQFGFAERNAQAFSLSDDLFAATLAEADGSDRRVQVFERDGTSWRRTTLLRTPLASLANDEFGATLHIRNGRLLVSASTAADCTGDDSRLGAVLVYEPDASGQWTLATIVQAPADATMLRFAQSMAADERRLIVSTLYANGFLRYLEYEL